jgi:hypothetical protein
MNVTGNITVVNYDEETGVLSVDIDAEGVKMLTSYALNALLREYCEPILETEKESSRNQETKES